MKKFFLKYLLLAVILNAAFFVILIFTAWDDGNSEGNHPLNNLASFMLNYILGFPTGFFFGKGFDMRLFLLIPINTVVQYFGYHSLKKLLYKNKENG